LKMLFELGTVYENAGIMVSLEWHKND